MWDNKTTDKHYLIKEGHNEFVHDKLNVKYLPVVDAADVILAALFKKLGLKKKFVKAILSSFLSFFRY